MTDVTPVPGVASAQAGSSAYGAPRGGGVRLHKGIDYYADVGTDVVAVTDGTVDHGSSEWMDGFTGFGRHVVTRHPSGLYSFSTHLDTVAVEAGQVVKAGDVIGTVGRSKFSKAGGYTDDFATSEPHLHFGVGTTARPVPEHMIDPGPWLASLEAPARSPLRNSQIIKSRSAPPNPADDDQGALVLVALLGAALWLA